MGPNLKFSAYFAGSAFLIAGLTGAVAGVGFGTLLLRAFIGAVLFGGLGYGIYLVISTRLPELLSSAGASSDRPSAAAEGYGENVDIVVDDEIGPTEEPEAPAPEAPATESEDLEEVAPVEEVTDTGGAEQVPQEASGAGAPEEPEELEEVASADEAETGGDDGLVEEVEEVAAAPSATGGESADARPGADIDENSVDKLPDIGGFAGEFEAEGSEVVEEDETGFGGSGSSGRAGNHGVNQDPEVIAKALQTVIKRDE